MPAEYIKTHRAALRKIAEELGWNPDELTRTKLKSLERIERAKGSWVSVKEPKLREIATNLGMNPEHVTYTELSQVVRVLHAPKQAPEQTIAAE